MILSSQICSGNEDLNVRSCSLKREETTEKKKEKRDKIVEKGNGGKGDEWKRPKEGQNAEDHQNVLIFFIDNKTKSEHVFLADSLP